jgi:uncharacterized protein involved in exopolysaccharide biosynthesis
MTFQTFIEAIWRRRLAMLVVLVLGSVAAVTVALHVQPRFTAESTVLMVAEPAGQVYNQAPQSPIKPILSTDLPLLASTPTVLQRVSQDLKKGGYAFTVEALQKRVKARLSGSSSVLIVRFTGDSEREAIAGANAVASEITKFYRDNATRRFGILVDDLRRQMSARRAQLRAIDVQLQSVIADHPYLETKDGSQSLNTQYERLLGERGELVASLAGDAAAAAVTSRRPHDVEAVAHRDILENDPTFHSLSDQYARDNAQLERMRSQYSSTYPGLRELEQSVALERRVMLERQRRVTGTTPVASVQYSNALGETNRANAVAQADRAKVRGLDQVIADTKNRLQASRLDSAQLASLQRERDAATTAYNVLSSRLAEATANKAEAGSIGSVNILDLAAYTKPVIYRTPEALAIAGIFFVLALALASLFALEAFDKRLATALSVEQVYGVPVIATLK